MKYFIMVLFASVSRNQLQALYTVYPIKPSAIVAELTHPAATMTPRKVPATVIEIGSFWIKDVKMRYRKPSVKTRLRLLKSRDNW